MSESESDAQQPSQPGERSPAKPKPRPKSRGPPPPGASAARRRPKRVPPPAEHAQPPTPPLSPARSDESPDERPQQRRPLKRRATESVVQPEAEQPAAKRPRLGVYACKKHDAGFPMPGMSVVVADSEDAARALLDDQLKREGLMPYAQKPYDIAAIDVSTPRAYMLYARNA